MTEGRITNFNSSLLKLNKVDSNDSADPNNKNAINVKNYMPDGFKMNGTGSLELPSGLVGQQQVPAPGEHPLNK